ncbi:hypothetical protein ABG768_003798 [Culter alburnus]|uniref:PAT complex subunit Asterix n=1 Tax=Culter alburnus TaxID=194366 RepID=A0AAW2A1V4_CULAL
MTVNNMADPRRPNKIFRYKPPNTETNPTLEDPTPDYMNLLGMIFSMCGLMLKVIRTGPDSRIFSEKTQTVLVSVVENSSVIMERAPSLRKGGKTQPQGYKHRCHPPTSGSSVCANPTYFHAVYDMSNEACQVDSFDYSKTNGGETVVTDGTLYSLMPSESLVPPVRRRGGLVDHRDVIKAHQSHKLQSTPQARRKQWE